MEEGAKALSDIPAINRFLSYCRIRTVPSKTVIIHAGDLPDILYYIISGSVEVMIEDEDGNEMVLAYLNKGQFFGEMGLFYEQPTRSAWVRTRQQSELAEMTYPRFRQIAAESPGLIFELATQLATRLDRTNRKLGDLAFVDVTGRVAHAIMDLCGEPDAMTHPEGMQIKVSRQELSRLVGCSREMAGRVLKVLEDQGLLRATGKTIVVFNARPKTKTRPVIVPANAKLFDTSGAPLEMTLAVKRGGIYQTLTSLDKDAYTTVRAILCTGPAQLGLSAKGFRTKRLKVTFESAQPPPLDVLLDPE